MRTAKVHINPTDLQRFQVNEMQVDPYWNNLYNPNNYKVPWMT